MSKPKNPIQMAVIGAAHGIKGELRVKTFTGDPLALADYGPLYARDGRAFEITDIRPANEVASHLETVSSTLKECNPVRRYTFTPRFANTRNSQPSNRTCMRPV